ncbi:hypothetical protein [Rubinisphaera brasiliensis]|uniref:Uncharacterized protein n=1 Tax=Rubinisphaera brasiliensis (strain ATCC 49424 / DSM 5305 / JCM 21570 / IAM 15109 / NBRC 103401 / IFAM 1448) TaxID=756272 RepID=F0SNJ0_RUBBR|nr:hypothetical protein [Rubinisphaera brasiliensis]ADY57824.1 hypothetical protein Plabr_0194 [Rubinisphaera brasiliensis DSM 5305]
MTPEQSARLVRQFRRRIGATHQELAELWECDFAEVIAAVTGGKSQQWIVDRFWFFTGINVDVWQNPAGLSPRQQQVFDSMFTQLWRKLGGERRAEK